MSFYGNPSYYVGYYLRSKVDNLFLNGSTASEQNNASTQAHIGIGGQVFSIIDHACALVNRETEEIKQNKADNLLHCHILNYQSK